MQSQLSKTSKLIQDWTPYNESVIWDIANEYYKNKGIAAFSNNNNNSVPHDINTNYQNALAIAKLVKAAIEINPLISEFQVLESGAGSGLFSRQFLHALRNLGINKRVKLLVSDYSLANLKDIQTFGVLNGFIEGEEYEIIEFDVLNSKSGKKLNGENFQIKNLISAVFNYVLDALPVTVLRKHFNSKIDGFEELYLKVKKAPQLNYDIMHNRDLMGSLDKEFKWVNYDIELQSESEKECYESFKYFHQNTKRDTYIPYPYGPIQACENILNLLDVNGFIFTGDIPARKTHFCQIVGNALAHEVDNEMIGVHLQSLGYIPKFQDDELISRMIVCKNSLCFDKIDPVFKEVFVDKNMVNRYADLRDALIKFDHKESADVMKYVLDEFEKVCGESVYLGIFKGNYYGLLGDREKAAAEYEESRKLDFTNCYQLADLAKRLRN
jgi:hypothetical protein